MSRGRAFLARLGLARAIAQADPPTDWQAATAVCIAAPTEASPRWHAAAVTARTPQHRRRPGEIAPPADPVMVLYAYGARANWTAERRPAAAAGALVARALARAVAVDVQVIVDHLPPDERDALLDATHIGDEHLIAPRVITLGKVKAGSRWQLPTAHDALVQIRSGLIDSPAVARIDLPHAEVANHTRPLAKLAPDVQRTLLCIAVAAQHARASAEVRPWRAVTPEGTAAAVWAELAASTTIICATCARIDQNCATAREQAAAQHCQRYGIDPYLSAGPGLGSIARSPALTSTAGIGPASAPSASPSSLRNLAISFC